METAYHNAMSKLTHLDHTGAARMVDVSDKAATRRMARAESRVQMRPETLAEIARGGIVKGDVFAVARVAGIQAAKRTSELIPLCHPLALSKVDVEFEVAGDDELIIRCTCRTTGPTGVEMESLTGASIAALTVYDMCKAIDRGMTVASTRLLGKEGGESGSWSREPG